MDDERSISEAVRHLEDLRAAGYITPEQFREEVRVLLDGMDDDEVPEFPLVQDPETEADCDPVIAWSLDAEAPGPPPEPDPPLPDEEPRLQHSSIPPGPNPRVIIKGKVPWETKEESSGLRVEPVSDSRDDKKPPDDKEIHHRQLARLASRDVTRLQRKRDPRLVALASLLVPGLGHFMLDMPGPGAAFALIWTIGLSVCLAFGEWDALYVLVPTVLLAAALAHKHALLHNYHLERRRLQAQRRAKEREGNLDLERSVREGEWERMGLGSPKD